MSTFCLIFILVSLYPDAWKYNYNIWTYVYRHVAYTVNKMKFARLHMGHLIRPNIALWYDLILLFNITNVIYKVKVATDQRSYHLQEKYNYFWQIPYLYVVNLSQIIIFLLQMTSLMMTGGLGGGGCLPNFSEISTPMSTLTQNSCKHAYNN